MWGKTSAQYIGLGDSVQVGLSGLLGHFLLKAERFVYHYTHMRCLWLANCYGRADFTGNRAAQVNWLSLSERIRWQ